jgi:hypothetical protein
MNKVVIFVSLNQRLMSTKGYLMDIKHPVDLDESSIRTLKCKLWALRRFRKRKRQTTNNSSSYLFGCGQV